MADDEKKEGEEDVSGHELVNETDDSRRKDAPGTRSYGRDEDEDDVSGHQQSNA